MRRRDAVFALVALMGAFSFPRAAPAASASAAVNQIEVGPWAFTLPSSWALDKKHEPNAPYFESADGTKGCYVKSLLFPPPPSRTPDEIATYVQQVSKSSLERNPQSKWVVVREESLAKDGLVHSLLVLFDGKNQYCILSKVLVRGEKAVQLTLHDYNSQRCADSVKYFSPILESLRVR